MALLRKKSNNTTMLFAFCIKCLTSLLTKNFIVCFKKRVGMTDIEYHSLVSQVNVKRNSLETNNKNKLKEIEHCEEQLKPENKPTKKDR